MWFEDYLIKTVLFVEPFKTHRNMQDMIKKLHWKCRRGMKEMDILFEHYLNGYYPQADILHQQAFQALCDMQDPIISDYLFERSTPDSEAVADIIEIMRHYSFSRQQH